MSQKHRRDRKVDFRQIMVMHDHVKKHGTQAMTI